MEIFFGNKFRKNNLRFDARTDYGKKRAEKLKNSLSSESTKLFGNFCSKIASYARTQFDQRNKNFSISSQNGRDWANARRMAEIIK